jgi:hypothetical protein
MERFPTFRGPFKDGEMIRASIIGRVYKMTPRQWAAYLMCFRKGGIMSGATLHNIKKQDLEGHQFIFPLSRKEMLAQPFMFPQEYIEFVRSHPLTYKFYIISDIGFARNFLAHAEKESKFNIRWKKKLAKNAKKAAKVRRENEQKHAKAMIKRWKKISKEQEKQKKFTKM